MPQRRAGDSLDQVEIALFGPATIMAGYNASRGRSRSLGFDGAIFDWMARGKTASLGITKSLPIQGAEKGKHSLRTTPIVTMPACTVNRH